MANPNGNGRVSLEDMEVPVKVQLPASPIAEPDAAGREDLNQPRARGSAYIPAAALEPPHEESVSLTIKLPISLKMQIKEISEELRINMTDIVLDLLKTNVPLIPRGKSLRSP